jgi:hypothetical protein
MAAKTTPEAAAKPEAPETPELTPAQRLDMATKLVERFALFGGVGGLIPVPVVDVAAVAGVQLQMLRRLSQIYNVPFSENSGKAVIAALAGTMIPATSGIGAASMLKSVPVIGTIAASFVMLDFNPPDYREFIKAQKEKWDARRKVAAPETPAPSAGSTGASAPST